MNNFLLEADGISFQYPDGTQAVNDLSFRIKNGERIVVLGQNGAGKSSLFLLLNAIHKASKGKLKLNGETVKYNKKGKAAIRQKVGVVFQEPDTQLFATNVLEELAFGPQNLNLPIAEVQERVTESLVLLNLQALAEKAPHALSYGQKKRVAMASILSMQPELVILDEPTAGLDAQNENIVKQALEKLSKQGKTLLIATHNLDFAWQWADRALVLKEGQLMFDGELVELFANEPLLDVCQLQKPSVLDLYLHAGGKLSDEIPRSLAELKGYLSERLNLR